MYNTCLVIGFSGLQCRKNYFQYPCIGTKNELKAYYCHLGTQSKTWTET